MTCVHQLHFVNCSWTSEVPLQSVHKQQVQNKIAKRKKHLGAIQFVFIHASYGRLSKIKIQFDSFEQSLQMWHKFLQIAAGFCCNLFKEPIWHILYSGSSSKMTKSIQVTHFLFFSNLNRCCMILLQDSKLQTKENREIFAMLFAEIGILELRTIHECRFPTGLSL